MDNFHHNSTRERSTNVNTVAPQGHSTHVHEEVLDDVLGDSKDLTTAYEVQCNLKAMYKSSTMVHKLLVIFAMIFFLVGT